MRKDEILGLSGAAVLDRGEATKSPSSEPRRPTISPPQSRRELPNDLSEDEDTAAFLRSTGRRRRIRRGLIPQSRFGRIAAAVVAILTVALFCFAGTLAIRFATTDARFRISSSSAIEVEGNTHLTRAQMLTVLGADVDRNIFRAPLEERKAQLEQIPWVEHATVMRLLPNRLRVHVSERTPVAFTREGGNIGMVDATGVLLDIPPDAPGNPNYSFPVVTGLHGTDPLPSRAQRMRLYMAFVRDLDAEGKKVSTELSEVDLSDPEDVKALIPDHSSEVLVHFGADNFLARYRKFKDHIDDWRGQYPQLSSVDMRYERQVVLQMPPRTSAHARSDDAPPSATVSSVPPSAATSAKKPALQRAPQEPHVLTNAGSTSPSAIAEPRHLKASAKTGEHRSAETSRKVEAIKAWMARREKLRDAAKAKAGPASSN